MALVLTDQNKSDLSFHLHKHMSAKNDRAGCWDEFRKANAWARNLNDSKLDNEVQAYILRSVKNALEAINSYLADFDKAIRRLNKSINLKEAFDQLQILDEKMYALSDQVERVQYQFHRWRNTHNSRAALRAIETMVTCAESKKNAIKTMKDTFTNVKNTKFAGKSGDELLGLMCAFLQLPKP